jgi:atrial natriuretic peptide receptor A
VKLETTRALQLEVKAMQDLTHDHIARFIGVCIDPKHQYIVTEYCPKGSLQDILENEEIKLDTMFKHSIMHDIVKGMQHIHNSSIESHGNLKSSNCVVDSRFVCKITDFGLPTLRSNTNKSSPTGVAKDYAYYRNRLWTAPELLRNVNPPAAGTVKGDVYSFGIILQEIELRNGPFYLRDRELEPAAIIESVKSGSLLRPSIETGECSIEIAQLM